jgi:hypothetical protein
MNGTPAVEFLTYEDSYGYIEVTDISGVEISEKDCR